MHSIRILLMAGALGLGGCATTGGGGDTSRGDFSPAEDCMFARTLRDWRPLDDRNLILFANGRTPYHVELVRPAFALGFDITIGVYDRDGRICPYGGDAIIVDAGGMPDRILIRSIERLSDEELDMIYVEYGVEPPPVVDEFEEIPVEGDE